VAALLSQPIATEVLEEALTMPTGRIGVASTIRMSSIA